MKRMKKTFGLMIMTLIGCFVFLSLIIWTIIEIYLCSTSDHQFNFLCVKSWIGFFLLTIILLFISVYRMMQHDFRRNEKCAKTLKNGGGVNHEKAAHGFIRKE